MIIKYKCKLALIILVIWLILTNAVLLWVYHKGQGVPADIPIQEYEEFQESTPPVTSTPDVPPTALPTAYCEDGLIFPVP